MGSNVTQITFTKEHANIMKNLNKLTKRLVGGAAVSTIALLLGLGTPFSANADEADAKRLLKAMSDYMASQDNISFGFDASLEVITKQNQKLALVSSGTIRLDRPGKIHATRNGGHAGIEVIFDGKKVTLFGKNANRFTEIEVSGTVDDFVDTMRNKYHMPLPAADLVMSNNYDQLMDGVTDVKDLGSGIVDGKECDYLAFRKENTDWQIWIAQGDMPYPCRYAITSKDIAHSPQYTIQLRNWATGQSAASSSFEFSNSTNATKVNVEDLKDMSSLPGHFKKGNK
jgi:hypothetical protein